MAVFFSLKTDGNRRRVPADRRECLVHGFFVFGKCITYLAAAGNEHQPKIGRGAAASTGFEIDLIDADKYTFKKVICHKSELQAVSEKNTQSSDTDSVKFFGLFIVGVDFGSAYSAVDA